MVGEGNFQERRELLQRMQWKIEQDDGQAIRLRLDERFLRGVALEAAEEMTGMTNGLAVWEEWLRAAILIGAGAACLRLGLGAGHRSARSRHVAAAGATTVALAA